MHLHACKPLFPFSRFPRTKAIGTLTFHNLYRWALTTVRDWNEWQGAVTGSRFSSHLRVLQGEIAARPRVAALQKELAAGSSLNSLIEFTTPSMLAAFKAAYAEEVPGLKLSRSWGVYCILATPHRAVLRGGITRCMPRLYCGHASNLESRIYRECGVRGTGSGSGGSWSLLKDEIIHPEL